MALECPRCGYGLAGVYPPEAPAWPLECVCPECALGIRSQDILREAAGPQWLVESRRWTGRRFRGLPRRALATLVRSLLPWRFWQRVRMEQPIRPRSLLAYALLLLLPVLLWCTAWVVIFRAALLIRELGVRWDGLPYLDLLVHATLFWYPGNVQGLLDSLERWAHGGSPSQRWVWFMVRQGPEYSCLAKATLPALRQAAPLVTAVVTGWVGTLAAFALLPIARRRARVRWSHLLRAGIYGLVTLWPLPTALLVVAAGQMLTGAFRSPLLERTFYADALVHWTRVALLLQALTWFLWWHAVTRHYLRMERPAAVAASVTLVGVFAGAAIPFATVLSNDGLAIFIQLLWRP